MDFSGIWFYVAAGVLAVVSAIYFWLFAPRQHNLKPNRRVSDLSREIGRVVPLLKRHRGRDINFRTLNGSLFGEVKLRLRAGVVFVKMIRYSSDGKGGSKSEVICEETFDEFLKRIAGYAQMDLTKFVYEKC